MVPNKDSVFYPERTASVEVLFANIIKYTDRQINFENILLLYESIVLENSHLDEHFFLL